MHLQDSTSIKANRQTRPIQLSATVCGEGWKQLAHDGHDCQNGRCEEQIKVCPGLWLSDFCFNMIERFWHKWLKSFLQCLKVQTHEGVFFFFFVVFGTQSAFIIKIPIYPSLLFYSLPFAVLIRFVFLHTRCLCMLFIIIVMLHINTFIFSLKPQTITLKIIAEN